MKNWFQHEGDQSRFNAISGSAVSKIRSTGRQRTVNRLIFLFCLLEIIDAIFTFEAVRGGLVWEGNILVQSMAGEWSFLVLKFLGAGLSALTIQIIYKHFPRLSLAAALSIVIFYGAVLAWNSSMILRILIAG